MIFRVYGLSIAWVILLGILLLGIYFPALDDITNYTPKYSFQYFFFYGLLSFNLCSSYTRQTNYRLLKRRALPYSLITSIAILIIIELIALTIYPDRHLQWFWNICGIIGVFSGRLLFRLLYNACY